MPVRDSWPYIDGHHPVESDEHIQLKNLAVHWLLQRGFDTSEIEEEYSVYNGGSRGQTDIYGQHGPIDVYIECETNFSPTSPDLSKGGDIPARRGDAVYLFADQGIYRLSEDVKTLTNPWKGEEWEAPYIDFDRISNLPMLDLRSFT